MINKKKTSMQKKPKRNDPCPCGSGKKYKKCCMLKIMQEEKEKKSLSNRITALDPSKASQISNMLFNPSSTEKKDDKDDKTS